MSEKIYDWRELRLKSMDILLCAGKSSMSRRIHKFQRLTGASEEEARKTHVAGKYGRLVQESTTFNKWAGKKGVQVNCFDEWLDNYNGEVYVKQLDFERTPDFIAADKVFWHAHRNDPYESGIMGNLELILCGLRLHEAVRKIYPDYEPLRTKSPHCGELQALRLKAHELLDKSVPVNRVPPWWWLKEIDGYLNVPVTRPRRIK